MSVFSLQGRSKHEADLPVAQKRLAEDLRTGRGLRGRSTQAAAFQLYLFSPALSSHRFSRSLAAEPQSSQNASLPWFSGRRDLNWSCWFWMVTVVPGATELVIKALEPITAPLPITVLPPRMEAPA